MSEKIFPEGDNPNDPLKRTLEQNERELMRRFGRAADGFPNDAVIGAALNCFTNSIRQIYPNVRDAEARYNELIGKMKSVLLSHYDGVTGKRKSVFPFHQTISPGLFESKSKIHRH